MAKTVSGALVIKILCRYFGFFVVSQKGSHVKLRNEDGQKIITTIVPLHRELSLGTFRGILELAQVDETLFRDKL